MAPSTWVIPPVTVDALASTSKTNSTPDPPGYAPLSLGSGLNSTKRVANSKASGGPAFTKPGQAAGEVVTTKPKRDLVALRAQKAWDLAIGPAKSVPMQGFMMYMSGGGLQIFSLMIVFQLIKGAISGMMAVNTTFEPLESGAANTSTKATEVPQSFTVQKIVHCLSQGLLLGLGLYKCHTMGLLPTHESDWLAFSKQRIPLETSDISLGGWWQM